MGYNHKKCVVNKLIQKHKTIDLKTNAQMRYFKNKETLDYKSIDYAKNMIYTKIKSKGGNNMTNLIWETVDVKQISRRNGEPYASIGQGRIALNPEACDMIENIYSYEWINVMQAKSGNKVVKIGMRFTNEKDKNSLRATRRKYKGQEVEGINVNSKSLVKKFFGETKETTTGRYNVEKVDDTTIAIDILNEM